VTALSQIDSYLNHILKCLANLPEVTEVEINPEGLWRPAGSSSPFMSLLTDSSSEAVAAAAATGTAGMVANGLPTAAAAGADGASLAIKPEPGQPGFAAAAAVGGAGAGAGSRAADDSDDEEDEMAELR
jgi:hypothetical protein